MRLHIRNRKLEYLTTVIFVAGGQIGGRRAHARETEKRGSQYVSLSSQRRESRTNEKGTGTDKEYELAWALHNKSTFRRRATERASKMSSRENINNHT